MSEPQRYKYSLVDPLPLLYCTAGHFSCLFRSMMETGSSYIPMDDKTSGFSGREQEDAMQQYRMTTAQQTTVTSRKAEIRISRLTGSIPVRGTQVVILLLRSLTDCFGFLNPDFGSCHCCLLCKKRFFVLFFVSSCFVNIQVSHPRFVTTLFSLSTP